MTTFPTGFRRLFLLAFTLLFAVGRLPAADSPELADAKRELLEAFQTGSTDDDPRIKKLRSRITALEYVAKAAADTSQPPSPRLISVDFPGGTAASLLAQIAKSNVDGFNVIGEKADLAIDLPAFTVRNADPSMLASALTGILQPRGYILAYNGVARAGQSPVFTLRKLSLYESPVDQRMMPQFQSYQLAQYLEAQSVDDIVGAIRAAWELDPAQKREMLRIKFHPPTGILLVSGPPQAMVLVKSVLDQLRRNPDLAPKFHSKSGPSPVPEKK